MVAGLSPSPGRHRARPGCPWGLPASCTAGSVGAGPSRGAQAGRPVRGMRGGREVGELGGGSCLCGPPPSQAGGNQAWPPGLTPCPVVPRALRASLSCSPWFGAADPSQSTAPNLAFKSSHVPPEMDLGANSYFMRRAIRFCPVPTGLCILTPPKPSSLRPSLPRSVYHRGRPAVSPLCAFAQEGGPGGWLACVLTPRPPCGSESRPEPDLWAPPAPPPTPRGLASPSACRVYSPPGSVWAASPRATPHSCGPGPRVAASSLSASTW